MRQTLLLIHTHVNTNILVNIYVHTNIFLNFKLIIIMKLYIYILINIKIDDATEHIIYIFFIRYEGIF